MAEYGIRLNADATGLVGGTEKSATALKGVEDQAKKTGQAFTEQGKAVAQASDKLRGLIDLAGRYNIDITKLQAGVARITSNQDAYNTILQKAIEQEIQLKAVRGESIGGTSQLTQRVTQLAVQTDNLVRSNSTLSSGLQEVWERKTRVSAVVTSLLGRFGGPVGIIATLGAAALAWVGFGNAAQTAGEQARVAGETARQAAERANSARNADRAGVFGSSLRGLRRGGPGSPLGLSVFEGDPGQPTTNAPTVDEALLGLSSPAIVEREHRERLAKIDRAFQAARARTGNFEEREELRALEADALAAAQKAYESDLKRFEKKIPASEKREQSAVDSLFKQATEMRAVSEAQTGATKELTAAETLRVKVVADMKAGLLDRQKVEASGLLVILDAAVANQKDAASRDAAQKSLERYNKETAQSIARMSQDATLQENATRKLEEHAQEIGLTTAQLAALRVARAEEKVALEEHRVALSRMPEAIEGELEANERRLESARRALDALREIGAKSVAVEQAKAADREWKRASDNIERSLTDALMRGFDKGKTFGENLRDSLVNMFKTLVLEPIIRPIAQAGASALLGAFGMPGSAGASGGFGGVGNILSGANSLFGGGGMGVTGAMEFGSGFLSTAFAGEAAAGLIEAGTVGFAGAGMEAGALGMGAMGAASAIPWVGAALLAANALGLFDEGGGPKPSELGVLRNPAGQFWVSQNNVPGGAANVGAYNAAIPWGDLNDPSKYDPAKLAGLAGYLQGGPNESAESMLQKLLAHIEPARVDAKKVQEEQLDAQKALLARQDQLIAEMRGIGQGLDRNLGIDGLQGALDDLSMSEFRAPLDRVAASRSVVDRTFAEAMAGDLAAVQAFPGVVQAAIGVGRDAFASGPQFQEIFVENNRMLQSVLAHQRDVQMGILAELPIAIEQSSNDQVSAIQKQTREVVAALAEVRAELAKLAA